MVCSDMMEHHPDALTSLPDYVKIVYWNYDSAQMAAPLRSGPVPAERVPVAGAPGVRFGSTGTELSVYYPDALRGLESLIPRMQKEGASEMLVTNWMKGSPHENTHYGFAYAADLAGMHLPWREDFPGALCCGDFGAPMLPVPGLRHSGLPLPMPSRCRTTCRTV